MDFFSNSKRTGPPPVTAALAIIVVLLLGPALRARAEGNADRAEALIREGVRLRAHDQTIRALPVFEEAYAIARNPRTAAQLGLCELELERYVLAERHLKGALASPDHPWIAKNRALLEHQRDVAAASIGEVTLSVLPPTAEVLVDGVPIDRSRPADPLRFDRGTVEIEIRAPGYTTLHEVISIVGGQRDQRTFALVLEPSKLAALAPLVNVTAPVAADGDRSPVSLMEASGAATSPPRSRSRTAVWVTGAAAVAALALGITEAVNAADKRDAFNDHAGLLDGQVVEDCGTANLSVACKPLRDAYDRALTLSIVGFSTAGALSVTSSVIFAISSSAHRETPREKNGSFACVPEFAVPGFGCAFRF